MAFPTVEGLYQVCYWKAVIIRAIPICAGKNVTLIHIPLV